MFTALGPHGSSVNRLRKLLVVTKSYIEGISELTVITYSWSIGMRIEYSHLIIIVLTYVTIII